MTVNNKLFSIAAFGLLLLCACNPAPKYARPPAPTPLAYKEAPGGKDGTGWKLAQPGDDKLRGKWWEIYNDPQLNALEVQVAISNQSIKAAEANFRAARALVVSARSALFPTIGASPAYSNSRVSGTSGHLVAGNGTINEYALPFDVSYTPDFWHRIRNTIAEEAFSAQASAADVATALLTRNRSWRLTISNCAPPTCSARFWTTRWSTTGRMWISQQPFIKRASIQSKIWYKRKTSSIPRPRKQQT